MSASFWCYWCLGINGESGVNLNEDNTKNEIWDRLPEWQNGSTPFEYLMVLRAGGASALHQTHFFYIITVPNRFWVHNTPFSDLYSFTFSTPALKIHKLFHKSKPQWAKLNNCLWASIAGQLWEGLRIKDFPVSSDVFISNYFYLFSHFNKIIQKTTL